MPDIMGEVGEVVLKQKCFQLHFPIYILKGTNVHVVKYSVQYWDIHICICAHVVWSEFLELTGRMCGTHYQVLHYVSRFLLRVRSVKSVLDLPVKPFRSRQLKGYFSLHPVPPLEYIGITPCPVFSASKPVFCLANTISMAYLFVSVCYLV